jgi:hypothetical protein
LKSGPEAAAFVRTGAAAELAPTRKAVVAAAAAAVVISHKEAGDRMGSL